MRVLLVPDGDGRSASSHYRMIWPGEEAQVRGVDVTITDREDPETQLVGGTAIDRETFRPRIMSMEPVPYDLVVFQRPLSVVYWDMVHLLHGQGVKVAIELDDDFDTIPERNVAHPNIQPDENHVGRRWQNRQWLHQIVNAADLVICATPAIAARYGRSTPAVVVPNFVPEWYLNIDAGHEWERPRIGLAQKLDTHPEDFLCVRTQITRFLDRHPEIDLYLLGAGREEQRADVLDHMGLADYADQIVYVPYCPLDHYPDLLARCDVGLVPLEQCDFNEAKSALKGLEYAALGVPFIASPTKSYRTLLSQSIGLLATDMWGEWLDWLFEKDYRRWRISDLQRKRMRELTIEANIGHWIKAWRKACSSN